MMIFIQLFATFFKIGLFTIGGGYAMIPMIQDEVVKNGWLAVGELVDFIAIAESTPGPFAVNIATFVGMEQAGILGAACATLGVVLPSFIIILLIAKFFMSFKDNKYVAGAMVGLRPAVVGLIGSAVFSIAATIILSSKQVIEGPHRLMGGTSLKTVLIITVVFLISRYKNLHPGFLMGISALMGILLFGFWPAV
jgi:chromate transporter